MAWDSLAARPALFGARWGVPRARRVSRRASAIDHQNARPKGATNLRTLPVAYTFAASARPPAPGVGAGLPSLPLPLSRVQSERKFTCAEWLSASGYTASAGSRRAGLAVLSAPRPCLSIYQRAQPRRRGCYVPDLSKDEEPSPSGGPGDDAQLVLCPPSRPSPANHLRRRTRGTTGEARCPARRSRAGRGTPGRRAAAAGLRRAHGAWRLLAAGRRAGSRRRRAHAGRQPHGGGELRREAGVLLGGVTGGRG